MSRAGNLHRLQEIDLALDASQARLAEVEAALRDSRAVERARDALASAQARLRQAHTAAQDAELAVQSVVEKHDRTQKRLYGGSVKNPKELQDLEREAAALRRRQAVLEDLQLETMIAVETAESQLTEARETLAAVSADFASLSATLTAEKAELETAIQKSEIEREAAEAQVIQEDRETYARLRARKGKMAVSKLVGGACNACGMAPSTQRITNARNQGELIRCGNCGRILYVDL